MDSDHVTTSRHYKNQKISLFDGGPSDLTHSDFQETFDDEMQSEIREKDARPKMPTPMLVASRDFEKFDFVPLAMKFSTDGHNSEA